MTTEEKLCAPQLTTLPDFSDIAALCGLVEDFFLDWEYREACEEALREYPLRWASEIAAFAEEEAVADAKRGDFRALADRVKYGGSLGREARALIAGKLDGTIKTKPGRPRRTPRQNDLDWKTDAAREVGQIIAILKEFYPKEKGHTERALDIAAIRASERARDLTRRLGETAAELATGINRRALENYYRKSRYR